MIGWVLIGLAGLLAGILFAKPEIVKGFWDSVANWLNKTAANTVESMFGYKARENMLRATSKVTYLLNKRCAKNYATVYSKKDNKDDVIVITVLETTAPEDKLHPDMVEEIKRQRDYIQQYVHEH